MLKDERDLLDVLKFELEFLEAGGYGRSPRTPWRPPYIFEDSLTCMNYDPKEDPAPCTECVLIHLVPPQLRSAKLPCRHIPLNASGETLDVLYGYNDQSEIEETVGNWLKATIQHLEEERKVAQLQTKKPPELCGEGMRAAPLFQTQHSKCANPACPTDFHWTGGGRFFRFRPNPASQSGSTSDSTFATHAVHYWLCERCSHMFTLVYGEQCGVVLNALCPELPVAVAEKELSAAYKRS
jgi:hypothetical protein